MATKKPKKTGKKSSNKPKNPNLKEDSKKNDVKNTSKNSNVEAKKVDAKKVEKTSETKKADAKETEVKTAIASELAGGNKVFKGFFKKKYDPNETILTIFKTPKIWGAILGELIGTCLLSVLLLTLGVQPLYIIFGAIGITLAVFALSGANLNPGITVGMMITRRMSAIRGVLYIVAQIIGAWIGLLIVNAFRLASGTETELPTMTEVTGDSFWFVAMVELVGMLFIGFFFARAIKFKNALTFAITVTSGITFAIIFGIVVSQSFYEIQNSFIFNPAVAFMYQIMPTAATDGGSLVGTMALELLTYVVFPVVGCAAGFLIADAAAKLGDEGECCCCKASGTCSK